eukprot:SAG11_NODE_775_length_7226_cov_2.988214_4_plen_58_part_00
MPLCHHVSAISYGAAPLYCVGSTAAVRNRKLVAPATNDKQCKKADPSTHIRIYCVLK